MKQICRQIMNNNSCFQRIIILCIAYFAVLSFDYNFRRCWLNLHTYIYIVYIQYKWLSDLCTLRLIKHFPLRFELL